MKKTYLYKPFIFGVLSLIAVFAFAKQEKVVQIFRNGEVIQEYAVSDIDYIEINDLIGTPDNVNASVANNQITIKWNAVDGATYNIYRSPDNINFTLLASGIKETSYTDTKPLSGTNYYRVKAVVNDVESGYTTSAAATLTGSGMDNGIYLGITGFNQTLYNYPVVQLSQNTADGFRNFIDGLTMKNGTLLYYSVDRALSTMQSTQLPADISSAAIVTFTDGLDQGSMMMDVPYDDDMAYLDALNTRIKNETVSGQPITAFSIGIRGKDVADIAMFRANLAKLASSPENATEVTSMAEVNAKFQEIAAQLSQSNYIQTINLKMPGVSNGTLVRFTFDNVNSAERSQLYIEGRFNLKERSLEDVKYVGLTSTSGTTIKGTVDGIFVNFKFEGVHTDNNVLIKSEFTDEWTYITSSSSWQINSEFDKTENSDIVTERSSAVIMLVLDCSNSLADDFVKAQNNAKDFINSLTGSGEDNPGGNDETIYSTMPKDLTLAIWKDGARYYLTAEQYQKANLKDAVVEGLTIIGGGESFILSLNDVQTDNISTVATAKFLYEDILPTESQARIISARWSDINNALPQFGGYLLRGGAENHSYYVSSTLWGIKNGSYCYEPVLYGAGGNITSCSNAPYIRGVIPTDYSGPKYWRDPDDLKLSVIVKGERKFIDSNEYQQLGAEIEEVEGVVIIGGGVKFALALNDAQSSSISNVDTAMQLYGDIMPMAGHAIIISARWSEINSALSRFGGSQLLGGRNNHSYYVSSTLWTIKNGSYCYEPVLYGAGGDISSSQNAPYVRGAKILKN